ncbi:MAG TPA: PBP1A family penicillin-binding protein [Vicinamibacteria bacterium]|nr:PBP1A family penicillin-binding protein [Vicinamibacteria bacterium]
MLFIIPGMALPPARPVPRILTLRRVVTTALFAAAILGGALIGVFLAFESDLPQVTSLEEFQPNIITRVFAADGSVLGEFAIEKRVVVEFRDIPPVLRNAIVAVEDADFWKHIGINPWRIPGAALANLRSGRRGQGFSTLTMQLTRLLFLTPEKTYERKIKEGILAFQIEKNFTKEEILTLYCNQIYFGHGNYGVEAASRFYFGKAVKDLSLPEAALIAGIGQSPARLSPIEHPENAVPRRNHVLDRMAEEKYVTREEADAAKVQPLGLHLRKEPPSIAPHFLEEVRKYLEREYGSQRIYQGGLQVYTTLDPAMQRAAVRALRDGLRTLDRRARGFVKPETSLIADGRLPDPLHLDEWDWPFGSGDVVRGVVIASDRAMAVVQIGDYRARLFPADVAWTRRTFVSDVLPRGVVAPFRIVSLSETDGRKEAKVQLEQEPKVEGSFLAMDVKTGAVRAMAGGYDFEKSKFNRATQAMRQVGSAFKPIVYAAALETLGWTPSTILVDAPLSFPNPWNKTVWTPQNYDGAYLGPIPLRRAVEQSRNIPAVKTLQAVGVEKGIEYARKLGLAGELPPYLPIALGAGEATLTEMVAAYATFANQGLRMKPFFVERITDRDGNVVEQTTPRASDALRADTAFIMTSLLRGVAERGTAARARRLKRPIGGKTGTTNDFTDAWFIGFEPSLAAGVWVGFDEKKDSLGRGETGAEAALPIWMDFWAVATAGRPLEEYPIPGNVVFVPVDAMGRPGEPGAPGVQMEAFVAGTEPRGADVLPATTQ